LRQTDKIRAAKRLLKEAAFKQALADIQGALLGELVSTQRGETERREMCYLQIRALTELPGVLEAWSREADRKGD
jgi:hypothetical protein